MSFNNKYFPHIEVINVGDKYDSDRKYIPLKLTTLIRVFDKNTDKWYDVRCMCSYNLKLEYNIAKLAFIINDFTKHCYNVIHLYQVNDTHDTTIIQESAIQIDEKSRLLVHQYLQTGKKL